MINDFKKFARANAGVSSMVLDDVIKSQAGYLNPYILEERQLNDPDRHEGSCGERHDDACRHPRDGLCAGREQTGCLHERRRDL